MNGFVIFCQFILIYVSYPPYVRSHEPGHIYSLVTAKINTYELGEIYSMNSSNTYGEGTQNISLRYDGDSYYTIMAEQEKHFYVKRIFFMVRTFMGIMTDNKEMNVYLKLTDEKDAQAICLERRDYNEYTENDFDVVKVLTIDNIAPRIRIIDILDNGAINVTKQPTNPDQNYHQFLIHPTGDGPKPPIAILMSYKMGFRRASEPNYLVMEHMVGNGAFYFGLIFESEEKADQFWDFLKEIDVLYDMVSTTLTDTITVKLFENYKQ